MTATERMTEREIIRRDRRRKSTSLKEVERMLRWCGGMVREYGDPREVGTKQWLENLSNTQAGRVVA